VPKPTPYDVTFSTNWLSAAGTIILFGDIVSLFVLRVGPGRALRIYSESPSTSSSGPS
jgi:L-lactate permease